jgi:hypothetical protein
MSSPTTPISDRSTAPSEFSPSQRIQLACLAIALLGLSFLAASQTLLQMPRPTEGHLISKTVLSPFFPCLFFGLLSGTVGLCLWDNRDRRPPIALLLIGATLVSYVVTLGSLYPSSNIPNDLLFQRFSNAGLYIALAATAIGGLTCLHQRAKLLNTARST